jgi:AraC family transcriptional regulator
LTRFGSSRAGKNADSGRHAVIVLRVPLFVEFTTLQGLPNMTDANRAEYLRRIHCAQDYIERHLDEPLSLEAIANKACFSAYHFHRLYSAITGETLYQFILRLRLERAMAQLSSSPEKSITEIALDCGFSSSATFARAFRAEYALSASEYRSRKTGTPAGDSNADSKNRKALSKGGKAPGEGFGEDGLVDLFVPSTRSPDMPVPAKHVNVEEMEAFTVAYVRHVGPYAGDAALFGQLFGRLAAWAGPRGLLGPSTKSLCIYHDNPEITQPAKLRLSCCISVPPSTKVGGEIGLMEIAAGKYARAHFEISEKEFGGAWEWFMGQWMPQSGYQPADGLCYELCLNDPGTHPEGKHIVDLVEPVKPL